MDWTRAQIAVLRPDPKLAAPWSGRLTCVLDDHATPTGVLVRPDGVVAWATDGATDGATDTLAVTDLQAALRRWAGTPSASSEYQPVATV